MRSPERLVKDSEMKRPQSRERSPASGAYQMALKGLRKRAKSWLCTEAVEGSGEATASLNSSLPPLLPLPLLLLLLLKHPSAQGSSQV